MGSDVYDSRFFRWISILMHFLKWKATIVKSEAMKKHLKLKDAYIIPNGVDTDQFFPINQIEAREKIGWDQHIYILFGSNPERKEKNYELAEKACRLLNLTGVKLVPLINISHDDIPKYLNACDVLLLTSFYEGSPNIVKEAMACNCPVVTTDVGDVRMILGQTEGCFISGYEPENVAEKIALAVKHRNRNHFTEGRKQLINLGLDSNTVSRRILDIYIKVTGKQLHQKSLLSNTIV
jgi:glycosyltransferase involved in cell wall biosynthesis